MKLALAVPSFSPDASAERIVEGAELARRLGWASVWTTDHIVVDRAAGLTYGRVFEAVTTLAYVAGRVPDVEIGTSVIVVPQRNAVELGKTLATLDILSGGSLIVGVGAGWNRVEFANLGLEDRFRQRGVYLEEAVALWRHLWAGRTDPFEGRFHRLEDFVFDPLPARGHIPLLFGGNSGPAIERAARLGDWYQPTNLSSAGLEPAAAQLRAAASAAGRPAPRLSVRARVRFAPDGTDGYVLGFSDDEIRDGLAAFAAQGVQLLVAVFAPGTDLAEGMARLDQLARGI